GHLALVQVPRFDRPDLVAAPFQAADVLAGQAGDGANDGHDAVLLCFPSQSLVISETAGLRDGSAPEVCEPVEPGCAGREAKPCVRAGRLRAAERAGAA